MQYQLNTKECKEKCISKDLLPKVDQYSLEYRAAVVWSS